ncbi:glycosyltransferase family 2 protein [Hydrogenophaga sp.]|uniref:glycosyltransferase family 2 protein n=1 Tax=Hydrogenophaga sp. TaxID=1904254 RepID=UPI00273178E1|nr:glycosyltransferase family 2 protein [Hydrogenophaga sp.]MDP1683933.1 glycosyltransferase family 2 protein [Hydrogenophaga sp.]
MTTAPPMERLPIASIVMRTVGGRSREIRRAIASISANLWRPLEVIVVYQGAEDAQWDDIQQLPGEFPKLSVRIMRNAGTGDRRAENLNIGWECAQGRFLGFLDDDDTLAPNHLPLLIQAMASTGHAWAYAQVLLRKEDEALNIVSETPAFRRHRFSLQSLWKENFLPIHSFLVDRHALNEAIRLRPFHEDLDRSEDWDFLLRLAFWHEPAVVEEFTAVYHVSTGTRNTNLSLMSSVNDEQHDRLNRAAWARCKEVVDQRKAAMASLMWWAREYFDIESNVPGPGAGAMASSAAPQTTRRLRQRVLRKLIRILERLL